MKKSTRTEQDEFDSEIQEKILAALNEGKALSMPEMQEKLIFYKRGDIANNVIRLVDRGKVNIRQDWKMELGCMDLWP